MHDPVTAFVVMLFSMPGMALFMAGLILVFAVSLIVFSGYREYRPLLMELRDRWNLLTGIRGKQMKKRFFDDFAQIDRCFSRSISNAAAPAALILGWTNYRSLLVDDEAGGYVTTVRAAEAFDQLDEPARALEWWANIMVAIGLTVTFLGIVAALTEATSAMGNADSNAMEAALMGLLSIAATKFWTSIAGVLASIVLRVVARFRRRRIAYLEAEMFEALDAGVQFMPPEKVMQAQLKSLQRIELALAPQR